MNTRMIYCQKLKQKAEGLSRPPYRDEFGKKIYDTISKEAWGLWLKRQTMFINEYRLNVMEESAKELLKKECEKFLFTDKDSKPEGYTDQT